MKRTMITVILAASAVIALARMVHAQATPPPATQPTQPALDQAALERQFEQMMSGALLVGDSSDSRRPDAPPRAERYTIQSIRKVAGGGDNWLFTARIPFRGSDLAVPMVIPVKWAGDTPVISVTDLTIPGLGTYTARVVIYRDHYAGTWTGGDHGGQLWGRIERIGASTAPATTQSTGR